MNKYTDINYGTLKLFKRTYFEKNTYAPNIVFHLLYFVFVKLKLKKKILIFLSGYYRNKARH